MEKYIIDKEEFQLYYLMLQSNDLSIIKEGVQLFSDSFAKGRFILNSDKNKFCLILERLLNDKKCSKINKWIYKCTCFYSNSKIEDLCKRNFLYTTDSETLNWIISTLASRYYDYEKFKVVINELKQKSTNEEQMQSLDFKNIYYNASLFGHFEIEFDTQNISRRIFRENDNLGMYWMSKLFAYSDLAVKKNLNHMIKYEELDMLTESGDEQMQVYAYWGLVHRVGGNLKLIRENSKSSVVANDTLKWYYAGIIPGEYANRNYDFIEEILKSTITKLKNNSRAKEGILIGLNAIPYDSYFDGLVIEWYYSENIFKIKIKILEYLIKNVKKNSYNENGFSEYGSFFTVIQDECCDITLFDYIINYINLYKTLKYIKSNNKLLLDTDREGENMSNYSINGGNFYGPVMLDNSGTFNYFKNISEKDSFINILDEFTLKCDQKELVEEAKIVRNDIENKSNGLKNKLFSFSNNLANFITISLATPEVVQLAKTLIGYIERMFLN